jgi:hypothetical protein
MYLTLLKNIINRLFMYGKYICNSLADCIQDILKPAHNYDPIPKQIIEEREEIEEEIEDEERNIEEEKREIEIEIKEEDGEEKSYYTDLSLSWECKQCNRFNHKDVSFCNYCNIHTEVQQILEEIILKVYEKNIGLCEINNNLSNSPNTTTINRMAEEYNTEINNEEASISLDLNEWACIEKE